MLDGERIKTNHKGVKEGTLIMLLNIFVHGSKNGLLYDLTYFGAIICR